MERLEITGGKPLSGEINISGAKNEALKIIALAVLINGEFEALNVPRISDIQSQLEIFEFLGGKYSFTEENLILDGSSVDRTSLKTSVSRKLRASVVYLGPLLARFGEVSLPFPGGCAIGRRPIDTHLDAFRDLGAKINSTDSGYYLTFDAFASKKITLGEPSVTATENILMFLSYFEDDFEVTNCAFEPEIMALCDVLNLAGANIERHEERTFKIRGSKNLKLDGITMIPDRIEAFSYLVGFILTGGTGKINNFPQDMMEVPLRVLKEAGAKFEVENDVATIQIPSKDIQPFSVETAPYPGFPTDMQSPLSLVATLAQGESKINEKMFENRLSYIEELKKMGLKAEVLNKHEVVIKGPTKLKSATIRALDLRSGITLVLAALAAEGTSQILNGQIIDRGYEKLINKLSSLGAAIKRND